MSIDEFARGLRARTLSAREVTDQCLRRIRDEDSRLNAFILVMADSARQQADQADREIAAGQDRGPLHGVPISIKDLFDIAGTATTAASRVREGDGHYVPTPWRGHWSDYASASGLRVPRRASEEDLVLALLDDGVIVHPGYFFDFPGEAYLVVSLIVQPQTLADGLERIVARCA